MRPSCVYLFSGLITVTALLSPAGGVAQTVEKTGGPDLQIPVFNPGGVSKYSAAQVAFVQSWLPQLAPECPVELTAAAAESFLEELGRRFPKDFDRLLAADFPSSTHAPMLLRHLAGQLSGIAHQPLREKIAERRLAAMMGPTGAAPAEAAALLTKIRESSSVQFRRLLEGRLDEDDLALLVKKVNQGQAEPKPTVRAQPKELTAAGIVAEFARQNQEGAALQRLQAYTVEGRLTDGKGQAQDLLLFKMRPDRVKLVMRRQGQTEVIIGAVGERFWQQLPGRPVQEALARQMGPLRYVGEFIDPLFVGEGYRFERLPDGQEEGRSFYRLGVRRDDGSQYVVRIDVETFRQVGRENDDRSITRYSDFREIAGLTLAFREEVTNQAGERSTLVLSRITPNPGLIAAFFQPATTVGADIFQLEKFWNLPVTEPAQPFKLK